MSAARGDLKTWRQGAKRTAVSFVILLGCSGEDGRGQRVFKKRMVVMRVHNLRAAALLAASLSILGAADGKDGAKGDVNVLDGEWEIVNVVHDGLEAGGGFRGGIRVIKGETFTDLLEGKPTGGGTVKLDPSQKPPRIDLTYTKGPGKGTKRLGVYAASGDSLTIALAAAGKERPAKVESKPGFGVTLYEYRRK
jgi:uncharacterized protein (TIGR03067 family)